MAGSVERPDPWEGLRGLPRGVCIFVKSRGRPTSLSDVIARFKISPQRAANVMGMLEKRRLIKPVPPPRGL